MSTGKVTTVPRSGILVLSGYGMSVSTDRGHLVCSDGIADERRVVKLSKIAKLRRLVILGGTGYVTLQALAWLRDRGAALVVIGTDGELLLSDAGMVMNYSEVRRQQALTAGTGKGLAILRELLCAKLRAQGQDTGEMQGTATIQEIRAAEANAARFYFGSWNVDVPWDKPVPEHWTRFVSRTSELGKSHNKRASDPLNAVLNYCYALLFSEVKIACLQLGLDPGLGLMHDDAKFKGRDNLVLDLMEPLRPIVDKFVLSLAENGFKREHFHEGRDGHVRCLPALTSILAQQGAVWGQHAARVAEDLCAALNGSEKVPTPLTGRKAKASSARLKKAS